MNIIDYKCVYGGSSIDFSFKVSSQIQKGWQPFGGVSVSTSICDESESAELVYAQAMVKYEPQPARFITGNVDQT